MARHGLSLALGVVGLAGCFDPNDGSDSATAGSSSGTMSSGPTSSATLETGDPSGDPSGNPTGDPSGDPSGDPTGPTTTADSTATDATTAADTGATTGDATTGSSCADPNICADAAPDGWSGPVVLFRGDVNGRPPACMAPYPLRDVDAFGDLDVPAGDCGCECTPPANAYCDGGSIEYHGGSSSCSSAMSTFFVADGCAELGGEFFSSRYFQFDATGVQVFGGACTPVAEENIPAAEHESFVIACGGVSEAGTCDEGQVCVPSPESPFQDRLCVWQDGDVECPADTAYTEKEVAFDSLTDDRDCTTCTCGALAGTCVNPTLTMRADAACGGAAGTVLGPGECGQAGVAADSAELNASPDAMCPPQGGALQGDVTENGPHTICCTP